MKLSKSKAKKKLEHLVRQGKQDPRNSKLDWGSIKPWTTILPNKKKYSQLDQGYQLMS
jgi:hypothetical protein